MKTQRPLFTHEKRCQCPDCIEAHCQRIARDCGAEIESVRAAVAISLADSYGCWAQQRKETGDA